MQIVDHKAVADHIAAWMRDRLSAGVTTLDAVFGLSGGIDSALIALLCVHGRIPHVAVNLPCHSSQWSVDRSRSLANQYGITLIEVDVTLAADVIRWRVEDAVGRQATVQEAGSLHSCIRTPVLDLVAKCVGGLIVGTGNRDEDVLIRYFNKRGDGAVDISPIADLHKSEVRQLFAWLAERLSLSFGIERSAQAILDARPSADLWGGKEQYDEDELGLSYDDVEWADRYVAANAPGFWQMPKEYRDEHIAICLLDDARKAVLQRVSNIEFATKHKENPAIPVCTVHDHAEWFAD